MFVVHSTKYLGNIPEITIYAITYTKERLLPQWDSEDLAIIEKECQRKV